jgi:hypothetical protein
LAPLPTTGDAQKAQKALVYDPDNCAEFLPHLLTSALADGDHFGDANICGSFTGVNGPRRSRQDRDWMPISRLSLWSLPVYPLMRATLPISRRLVSSCLVRAIQGGGPTSELGRSHFLACASEGRISHCNRAAASWHLGAQSVGSLRTRECGSRELWRALRNRLIPCCLQKLPRAQSGSRQLDARP